jgi:hypothetical protein
MLPLLPASAIKQAVPICQAATCPTGCGRATCDVRPGSTVKSQVSCTTKSFARSLGNRSVPSWLAVAAGLAKRPAIALGTDGQYRIAPGGSARIES